MPIAAVRLSVEWVGDVARAQAGIVGHAESDFVVVNSQERPYEVALSFIWKEPWNFHN
jgi:hypothetical protein